jgi:hypothetical protein
MLVLVLVPCAERFRSALKRIALMKQVAPHPGASLADSLERAVEAYGVLAMVAMVAADAAFLEVTW